MDQVKEDTKVDVIEGDLDAILNLGAANVMLPSEEEKKPSVFTRDAQDMSFLNEDPESFKDDFSETSEESEEKEVVNPAKLNSEVEEFLAPPTDDEEEVNKGGRPTLDKEGMAQLTNSLIKKDLLIPFDDDKPLEDYTLADYEELIEANLQERERRAAEEIPQKFFESLPQELQYAAQYVASGGQDLKTLFRTLGSVQETREMNPNDENDAKRIIRSYLQATRFGNAEEIEEEITAWEDRGEIVAKANKFKPKLDAMSEQQIQYQLAQQEQIKRQQADQAKMYMDNVYKTLEPGELNGLKLDKKTQNLLFSGLVQPNYPSVSGNPTNLLGHLLEKYQYVEPNHGLIAEALWLLADPDGYRNKVRENSKKEVTEETFRKLKSEESRKLATSSNNVPAAEESSSKRGFKKIQRPSKNFFKR